MTPNIPSDHLIDPRIGHVGFWSPTIPMSWLRDHQLAEAGGWYRVGRRWMRVADDNSGAALRLLGAPVRALYPGLLGRIGQLNAVSQGWCVDA